MSMSIIATRCSTPSFLLPLITLIANQSLISRNLVLTSACAMSNSILYWKPVRASHSVSNNSGIWWDSAGRLGLYLTRQTYYIAGSFTASSRTWNSYFYILFRCGCHRQTDRHIILYKWHCNLVRGYRSWSFQTLNSKLHTLHGVTSFIQSTESLAPIGSLSHASDFIQYL
jgi:hypothetical protein